MLSRLVVPLDGSELAERTLPYATQVARARNGQLILVRVALGPPPSGFDWEHHQLAAVNEAEAYLAGIGEQLRPMVPVETAVPYGPAAPVIVEIVRGFEADGVVMTTHARTGPAHLMHGSVAEAVLETADVPVFLVQAVPGEAAAPPFDPPA